MLSKSILYIVEIGLGPWRRLRVCVLSISRRYTLQRDGSKRNHRKLKHTLPIRPHIGTTTIPRICLPLSLCRGSNYSEITETTLLRPLRVAIFPSGHLWSTARVSGRIRELRRHGISKLLTHIFIKPNSLPAVTICVFSPLRVMGRSTFRTLYRPIVYHALTRGPKRKSPTSDNHQ